MSIRQYFSQLVHCLALGSMAWLLQDNAALPAARSQPAPRPDSLSSRLTGTELRIRFTAGVTERYLKVLDLLLGTETTRTTGEYFTVRQGPRGELADYATFFAMLPYTKEIVPKFIRLPSAEHSGPVKPGLRLALPSHMPGELLVKFKKATTAEQIAQLNTDHGTTIKSSLALGTERIYRLQLPEGVAVMDMVRRYGESDLVEYAEPNYRIGIPRPPGGVQQQPGATVSLPLFITGDSFGGDSLLVRFRSGVREPVPELVALLYGVQLLEMTEDGVRYSLPRGINSSTTARLFKLCLYVMAAEPAYGR
ncbi:MAG: hypothetical protein HY692_09780 [Cyanobacteria bacterium NC_groundwater_1444_Ag_S-0.65um_54_12]|nr:hypothetical protein [Cyanobacteria bacterium NC_groundwater_1444_Ag_S-0.65um_54_12]